MVELRPARQPCPASDFRGAGVGVPEVVEALDGRVEKPRPGGRAALGLRPALPGGDRGQVRHASEVHPIKDTVKPEGKFLVTALWFFVDRFGGGCVSTSSGGLPPISNIGEEDITCGRFR